MTVIEKPQTIEKLQKYQAQYPERTFRIVYSTVYEVRTCEDCGKEIFTMAIGEYSTGGDLCSACKAAQDAESWKTIKAAGRECDERIAMHMSMD